MEKSKALEIAKPYFDSNKELKEVFVTDMGHVFYPEAKSYLMAHCKHSKEKYQVITSDYFKAKPKTEDKKEAKPKAEPKS